MKILNSVFLLLALSFVTVYSIETDCPPDNVFGKTNPKCKCSKPLLVINCTGITQEWITNFEPEKLYSIDTLIIENSPDLPFIADKFHNKPGKKTGVMARKVIFTLNSKGDFIKHVMDSLLHVASEEIIIKSTDNNNPMIIHNPGFPSDIKSIVLENVKITDSKGKIIENLKSLKTLQLKKVSFDKVEEKVVFEGPTRVEITDSVNFAKTLQYIPPNQCLENQEIVLNFQNNVELEELDMSSMFDDKKCKYYIDLSGSKLNPDFLNSKKEVFKKVTIKGQIFLIMRDIVSPLNCDGCFHKFYKSMAKYVHSVYCKGKTITKYIDQLPDSEFDACTN